ncbi:MAG: hypothetical protein QOF53_977 [Nocardioidaceae bacterium]|jgi:hypothetical protein|nr:hypothetical protein [Nocardioidaceae bacterium]
MSPHARRPLLAAASLVAVYALSTTSASAAAAPAASARPPAAVPVTGGSADALLVTGCEVVRFYNTYNPSMNKPRGHQDAPDHWSWAAGC